MASLGPVGISGGENNGKTSHIETLHQAVKKYEFTIRKEQLDDGIRYFDNNWAPFTNKVLPMTSHSGLSKAEKTAH